MVCELNLKIQKLYKKGHFNLFNWAEIGPISYYAHVTNGIRFSVQYFGEVIYT